MWFRRHPRVPDLPALAAAAQADRVLPLFVLDDRLLARGRFPSAVRTAFMLACLRELDAALRDRGARLFVRRGRPEEELPRLAREVRAGTVHLTADVSPWARARDARVAAALGAAGVEVHAAPGAGVVDDPAAILTGQGRPYTVFSPFARAWLRVPRRAPVRAPAELRAPSRPPAGDLPGLAALGLDPSDVLDAPAAEPGEAAARRRLTAFLRSDLEGYHDRRDRPAGGSSRLSPSLRWGCVSPLELDRAVAEQAGRGADDYRTELAWRDFYAAVLVHFPHVTRLEFQERYRDLEWAPPGERLEAWKRGRTGFPLVDAGMRQLLAEGWMHNRVRMVVGSFLTKDLHLDWRLGEAWFMERLLDGDMAANNGGWQWIASTGTDPAPYFQRLFNPMTQQRRFDPEGEYVRRHVPELRDVPEHRLPEPWTMDLAEQADAGCVIGRDYPEPIVDHAAERRRTIERYRALG